MSDEKQGDGDGGGAPVLLVSIYDCGGGGREGGGLKTEGEDHGNKGGGMGWEGML